MQIGRENSLGIRVIPPLVYLAGGGIGYGLENAWPMVERPWPWTVGLAVVAISLSALIVVSAISSFRKVSTPFDVRKPATSLVTDGPYRFSRNPGYLALTLFYVGLTIFLGSVWMLLLLAPILLVMHFDVVRKEEKHLESRFGEDYLRYKSRVRRWI